MCNINNPCLNNGQCIPNGYGGVKCICLAQFTGNRCEQKCQIVDPCSSYPCRNGGVCIPTGFGYRCECPTTSFGYNCDRYHS